MKKMFGGTAVCRNNGESTSCRLPAPLVNGINVNKAAKNVSPGLDNVDRRRRLAKGLANITGNKFIGNYLPLSFPRVISMGCIHAGPGTCQKLISTPTTAASVPLH